jgi:hypothetical protein
MQNSTSRFMTDSHFSLVFPILSKFLLFDSFVGFLRVKNVRFYTRAPPALVIKRPF